MHLGHLRRARGRPVPIAHGFVGEHHLAHRRGAEHLAHRLELAADHPIDPHAPRHARRGSSPTHTIGTKPACSAASPCARPWHLPSPKGHGARNDRRWRSGSRTPRAWPRSPRRYGAGRVYSDTSCAPGRRPRAVVAPGRDRGYGARRFPPGIDTRPSSSSRLAARLPFIFQLPATSLVGHGRGNIRADKPQDTACGRSPRNTTSPHYSAGRTLPPGSLLGRSDR